MSMRAVPPCIPRQWGPLSVEEVSVWILQYLPVNTADFIVWLFYRVYRMLRGGGRNKGIPGGKINPDWYPFSSHRVPPIDKGGFTESVGQGSVQLHSCITSARGKRITFQSKSTVRSHKEHSEEDSLETDVIVLCTGYRADWSWLHIPLPLSLPPPTPLFFSSPVSPTSAPSSTHSQNATNDNDNVRILDRDSALSEFARLRSISPITCTDGLFFVGYDPGPALIPLSAIRSQAKIVATAIQNQILSEYKSVHKNRNYLV